MHSIHLYSFLHAVIRTMKRLTIGDTMSTGIKFIPFRTRGIRPFKKNQFSYTDNSLCAQPIKSSGNEKSRSTAAAMELTACMTHIRVLPWPSFVNRFPWMTTYGIGSQIYESCYLEKLWYTPTKALRQLKPKYTIGIG